MFLEKPLKLLRTKLKILKLHQNKFENAQILKQYPQHYCTPSETSKMTKRKLKILKLQNTKIENFQNSPEERHIPYFLAYENFTQKNSKPPKWQEENWRLQNTKTKDLWSVKKKRKYLIFPLVKFHKKIKDLQNDKKKNWKFWNFKIQKQKTFKVHMKKSTYPISSLVKLHRNKIEDPQNDKKKIKDFETSKYKNIFFFKFMKIRQISPLSPLAKLHTMFCEDLQNDNNKNLKL